MVKINSNLNQIIPSDDLGLLQSIIDQASQVNINSTHTSIDVTPLHTAAGLGDIKLINSLIDQGEGINKLNLGGNTALHYAAAFNYEATVLLVKKGAKLHSLNQWKENPCFWAAQNNQIETLKFLLDKGADGLSCNIHLKTPFAMMADHGNIEGMQILFELGADVNAIDQDGKSPLSFAVENGHLDTIKWLHYKNSDLNTNSNALCALKNNYFDIALLLCSWEGELNLRENLDLLRELNANVHEMAKVNNICIFEKILGFMHLVAASYELISNPQEDIKGLKLVENATNELANIIDLNINQKDLFEILNRKDITYSLFGIYQLASLCKGYEKIKDQLEINHTKSFNTISKFINKIHALVDPLTNQITTKLDINHYKILDQIFEGKKIGDIDQNILLLKLVKKINKEEFKTNPGLYSALKIIEPYLQKFIVSHQEYKFEALQYNIAKIGTIGCSQERDNSIFDLVKDIGLLKNDLFQEFAQGYLFDKAREPFFNNLKVPILSEECESATSTKIQGEVIDAAGKIDLE